MKISVITVTESGGKTALRLMEKLSEKHSVDIYCLEKYRLPECMIFSDIFEAAKLAWDNSEGIIFISSCGIAVRAVSPLVKSKTADPCIIAVDFQGRFAVSLLSGHLGGGNALCRSVSEIIGAVPVITTASDLCGKFSPDVFAKANDLVITDMRLSKIIAARSINGEKIGMVCRYPYAHMNEDIFDNSAEYGICIGPDINDKPFENTLNLLPKNIIVGIGCKKNTADDILEKHILNVTREKNISAERISCLASIDIKNDEKAVKNFCGKYNIPFKTFSADELAAVNGDFESSDFVMKITGVDNVCQRSVKACGGENISGKYTGNGVACAVGELPVNIDFFREDILI